MHDFPIVMRFESHRWSCLFGSDSLHCICLWPTASCIRFLGRSLQRSFLNLTPNVWKVDGALATWNGDCGLSRLSSMILVLRAAISLVLSMVGTCLWSLRVNLVSFGGLIIVLTAKVESPDFSPGATFATMSLNLLSWSMIDHILVPFSRSLMPMINCCNGVCWLL